MLLSIIQNYSGSLKARLKAFLLALPAMKKILFAVLAVVLLSLGVTSLFAAPTPAAPLPETVASAPDRTASPLEKSLTPAHLRLLLLRMGFFYAGFICLLLALEFGTEPRKETGKHKPA